MANYVNSLPRDRDGEPLQEFPTPKLALARYAPENSSASSVITLTQNTTSLEVAAVGNSAVVKWIATTNTNPSVISAAGTENFDHVVPSGSVRRFAVPREATGTTAGSVVGINRENGLYQRVAIKSIGVASVLTAEF